MRIVAAAGVVALLAAAPIASAASLDALPARAPLVLKITPGHDVIAAGYGTTRPLGAAVRRFGPPTRRTRRGEVCTVRWRALGARFNFANLGGRNPCSDRFGLVGTANLTGSRWRTARGLRIGAPAAQIARREPSAIRCDRPFVDVPLRRGGAAVAPANRAERNAIRRCGARAKENLEGSWWLAPQYSLLGAAAVAPKVKIVVRAGRVRAFQLSIGAAGE